MYPISGWVKKKKKCVYVQNSVSCLDVGLITHLTLIAAVSEKIVVATITSILFVGCNMGLLKWSPFTNYRHEIHSINPMAVKVCKSVSDCSLFCVKSSQTIKFNHLLINGELMLTENNRSKCKYLYLSAAVTQPSLFYLFCCQGRSKT